MKKQSGFTLMELLVTVFIVGILVSVGVPSLKSFMRSNQLVAASNEILAALTIARSEAIKSASRVSICTSSDSKSCSGSSKWEDGWIVFIDANGDLLGTGAPCTATGTDCLLRVQESYNTNDLSIIGEDEDSAAVTSFTFTSRGLPKATNGSPRSGTFNICSLESGATVDSRAVVMSFAGRARVSDNSAVITQCP